VRRPILWCRVSHRRGCRPDWPLGWRLRWRWRHERRPTRKKRRVPLLPPRDHRAPRRHGTLHKGTTQVGAPGAVPHW